jgi:hypothetical protein
MSIKQLLVSGHSDFETHEKKYFFIEFSTGFREFCLPACHLHSHWFLAQLIL